MGATFDTSNMGVSALTAGAITCLSHGFPDAEVFLMDYGKEPRRYSFWKGGQKVEVRLLNLRFSKKFWLPNNVAWLILTALLLKLVPIGSLRRAVLRRNAWLQEIEATQLFAAISGGDSFSDIYGLQRLLYVSLPQVMVLLLGKRLVLLPQTLGPFKSRFSRFVAKYILTRAELVYSRDGGGVVLATEMLGASRAKGKVRFCNDVAFVMEPHKPAKQDILGSFTGTEPLAGLNVSGLLAMGGYTGHNMFGLKVDYNHLMESLIEFLIEMKGMRVLLVPHVFGVGRESDTEACERVYGRLRSRYEGRLGCLRGDYDQHEIKQIIGGCEFFVGARMHACIAAISQSVPAVAVAYSGKFKGVLETVGMGSFVADPRTMTEDEILDVVNKAHDTREKIRAKLQATIPSVQTFVLDIFKPATTAKAAQELGAVVV